MGVQFTDLKESGKTAIAILTTDIPANTLLLAPLGYAAVGGFLSVVGITLMLGGIESDI